MTLGGTAGVTTRSLFASDDGGDAISPTISFPFYDNITTSVFVSAFVIVSVHASVRTCESMRHLNQAANKM